MNDNLKKIFHYSTASIINAVLSFASTMILTRLLDKGSFGYLNLFNSASNVLMGIVCVGLDSAYIRFFYAPPSKHDHKQLAAHCVATPSVLSLLALILFSFDSVSSCVAGITGLESKKVVLFLVINAYALSILRFLNINYRMREKTGLFVIQSIIITCVTKFGYIAIALFEDSIIDVMIVGTILCSIVAVIFAFIQKRQFLSFKDYFGTRYGKVYKFALFDAPLYNLLYLNSFIPQLITKQEINEDALGIYSGMMVFVYAIQVISSGFATFWAPYVYKNYREKQEAIKDVHEIVMYSLMVLLVMMLCFGKVLFLFLGKDFRESQSIMGFFLIAPMGNIILETTSYGISIERKNYISLVFHCISFGINILLGVLLAPYWGLAGIAIASMVSALIMLIGQSFVGQKYYRSMRSFYRFFSQIVIMVLLVSVYYLLYDYQLYYTMISIALLLIITVLERKTLSRLIRSYIFKKTQD